MTDLHDAFTAPFDAPSAGPPRWQLYLFLHRPQCGRARTGGARGTHWHLASSAISPPMLTTEPDWAEM